MTSKEEEQGEDSGTGREKKAVGKWRDAEITV